MFVGPKIVMDWSEMRAVIKIRQKQWDYISRFYVSIFGGKLLESKTSNDDVNIVGVDLLNFWGCTDTSQKRMLAESILVEVNDLSSQAAATTKNYTFFNLENLSFREMTFCFESIRMIRLVADIWDVFWAETFEMLAMQLFNCKNSFKVRWGNPPGLLKKAGRENELPKK